METTEESENIFVWENEVGKRLDVLLATRYEGKQSRTYFQSLIEMGNVLVNGQAVKKRYQPAFGDEIEIAFLATPELDLSPEAIPLSILYEDEHILIVDKPAGMVVHPVPGNWSGTFVNALLYHCQGLPGVESIRPGIVHRLDKDTTGLLIAAKTIEAQQQLIRQFASRQVYKEYLAICHGKPKEGKIEAPIGRHPFKRKEMAVLENGRPAITQCRVLQSNGYLSLLSLILETGRTHQIRVHLKHLGTPVIGDSIYGNATVNQRYAAKRQLLHAHRLRFSHPISGQELAFEAAIPEDMIHLIKTKLK